MFIEIPAEKISHLSVPSYDSLSVEKILTFLTAHDAFWYCIPDVPLERRKLPRQWIINVAWTIVGQPFGQWVKA